jgi:hypothetical protein
VIAKAPEQPGAPGVGRLHLEGAIQLDRMTDDLVRAGCCSGVRDDDDLAGGGGKGRGLHEGEALAGQGHGELREGRIREQGIIDTAQQDFPSALVTEHVIQFLAHTAGGGHHEGEALGQRERLIDDRPFGRHEQLARELGQRGQVAVRQARVEVPNPPGNIQSVADHLVEAHAAGVDLEGRAHGVAPHVDRAERVSARAGRGPRTSPGLGLQLAVDHGAPVGLRDRLAHLAGDAVDVGGGPQGEPDVTRSDHAISGEHADAEAEPSVLPRGPTGSVLCGRGLRLRHLHPDVGVCEMRKAPRIGDELGKDDASRSIRSTSRRSVAASTNRRRAPPAPSPGPDVALLLDHPEAVSATIEERMPDPCGPVVRTSQPSPCQVKTSAELRRAEHRSAARGAVGHEAARPPL